MQDYVTSSEMKKVSLAFFLLLTTLTVSAQSKDDKEKARSFALDAVKKTEKEEYEESIKLLKKAQKLDPENPAYAYEIAYAYVLMKQYPEAISTIEPVIGHKDATDKYYILLASANYSLGNHDKALEIYKKAFALFPASGSLYLEAGMIEYNRKNVRQAIYHWEKGVAAEPGYTSNYYLLAKALCPSQEKAWGIMYGEIFINLEKETRRSEEISKLLYDTYREGIQIKSASEASVTFAKNRITLVRGDKEYPPFGLLYEKTMQLAVMFLAMENETEVNTAFLSKARSKFIANWYESKYNDIHPNPLFDLHQKMVEKGHFEAYTYWVLRKGNEEAFNKWAQDNSEKFKAFAGWFHQNPLQVNDKNKFYRTDDL
jgi:tetratricopeptide (TPR) repeat protein